jgi:hypothetical protein
MRNNPRVLEYQYINEFSEVLTLRLDKEGVITFNHTDIHDKDEFEEFEDGVYIFDKHERNVIKSFIVTSKELMKEEINAKG